MRRHTPLGGALWLVVGFLTLVGMWMIIVLAAWGVWHTANALAAIMIVLACCGVVGS